MGIRTNPESQISDVMLPGLQNLLVPQIFPSQEPSEVRSFLHPVNQLPCRGPNSAEVFPILVKEHLQLVETIDGGC